MKKSVFLFILLTLCTPILVISQCGLISLIGEFNDWNDDHYLTRHPEMPDNFSTILILTPEDDMTSPPDGIIEMKFRENGDWTVNWGNTGFPSGVGILNGQNIPVPVGNYLVTFNCATAEYNFQVICGEISLIGEFNGWADDLMMTRDAENLAEWSVFLTLTEEDDVNGDGIIEMKFRENRDWTVNWGDDDFPSGVAILNGQNIPVPLGKYEITFNYTTGEYYFHSTCGEISLIGEFNDWNDDLPLYRDLENPDVWKVLLTLTNQDDITGDGIVEMKFRENRDWSANWGDDSFPSGTGTLNGLTIPVPLDSTSITTDYQVIFNCATGEYLFEATSGNISIIGAFIGWNGDVPMNRNAADPNIWSLTRSWYADSDLKFRENKDWVNNWGNSTFPDGTGMFNGPNIPLTAGKYDVTFNTTTFAYSFTSNPDICGEIGLVGNFNEWGGGDPPTDVWMIRDATYPSQFSIDYSFNDNTTLLFRMDADPTFINAWGGTSLCQNGVMDPSQIIQVPGGYYHITFNCKSGDYCFQMLTSSVTAPKVYAMSLDGILDESDWDISQPVTKLTEGLIGADPNQIFFGVTYSETHLYVGISVTDAFVQPGELIEIFIDGNKSGDDYDDHDVYFTIDGTGTIEVIIGPYGGINPEGIFHVVEGGYVVEVSIPWVDLGITPEEGEQIGFDIIAGDADEGTVEYTLAWNGGTLNYGNTSLFGTLTFGPLTCGCVSMYNETIGDVILRNLSDQPHSFIATYDFDGDYDVIFRKDKGDAVRWGNDDFPVGYALLGGPEIPVPFGRYRIQFDCVSGQYFFYDAPPDEGVALADYTVIPPVIDGSLDEYNLMYSSEILGSGGGPVNNTVTWGALWDLSSLYIGAHVVDSPVEGTGNPWDNDGVEFFIDGNNDKDGPYDLLFDTYMILDAFYQPNLWIRADGAVVTDYDAEWMFTEDGYNVELRFGWGNIYFEPGKGRVIGWSLGNNDSDHGVGRDYETVWYGDGNNWASTIHFGDLQMNLGPYTHLDERGDDAGILLYPNPAHGVILLRTIGDKPAGEVCFQILDVTGRTVYMENVFPTDTGDLVQLNIDGLVPGLYIVCIVASDGYKAVKKLIVR
ncbi:MAG: T9SS type A sorting domain-containing protein [Bacteroidetes bacterium]|nr:T9SS type A sorting domain-containing protein [Bacteroidota bacterium]